MNQIFINISLINGDDDSDDADEADDDDDNFINNALYNKVYF